MAKHTREFHTCDACGAEIDKPYRGGEAGTYSMEIDVDYAVAGHNITWSELCHMCNEWLGSQVARLKDEAKDREATK